MSGENELKPCPFCGAKDEVGFGISKSKLFDEVRTHHHVECAACGVMGPSCETDEEALEGWNRRATTPGTEAVPKGTLELLGKICARFREIEYQRELNQPHIGDGILYEMLEDLNSILATHIIDMVREHDGNHIPDTAPPRRPPMPKAKPKTPKTVKLFMNWTPVSGFRPWAWGLEKRSEMAVPVRIVPEAEYQRMRRAAKGPA